MEEEEEERGRSAEQRRKNKEERRQLPTSEGFRDAICCPHAVSFIYSAHTY